MSKRQLFLRKKNFLLKILIILIIFFFRPDWALDYVKDNGITTEDDYPYVPR